MSLDGETSDMPTVTDINSGNRLIIGALPLSALRVPSMPLCRCEAGFRVNWPSLKRPNVTWLLPRPDRGNILAARLEPSER